MLNILRCVLAALCALTLAPAVCAQKAAPPGPKQAPGAKASPLAAELRGRIGDALAKLEAGGDFAETQGTLRGVFDQVIAYADLSDKELFIDAAYAARLAALTGAAPVETRVEVLEFLRSNDELGRTLVFLLRPEDDRTGACKVLAALRARDERGVLKHPGLTAALCVVRDKPLRAEVAEKPRPAPDAADLMEYYTRNEARLLYDPDQLPAGMLVYVVSSTSPIGEMTWAFSKYAGNRNVGKRFFEVPYDTRSYKQGAEKKITAAGVTLENIRKVGGVCAEQAYFAAQVGKAIGAPTTEVYGQDATVGHAWVGYLERTPRGARWNFDEGRYEDYEDVRGDVPDPQTGKMISDGDLAISAFGLDEPKENRRLAVAMVDAARRLGAIEKEKAAYPPPAPESAVKDAAARSSGVAARLDLLEHGLRASPGCLEAWGVVQELGRTGGINSEQRTKWFDAVNAMCGKQYPDFCLDLMSSLIEGETDAARRRDAWEWLAGLYNGKPTLVARVRVAEGASAERHKDLPAAMACYQEIVTRYANDGPFVVDAAVGGLRVLNNMGSQDRALAFLKEAWQRIKRPAKASKWAAGQSSFARVGFLYMTALRKAGMTKEADAVRKQLEALAQ